MKPDTEKNHILLQQKEKSSPPVFSNFKDKNFRCTDSEAGRVA